MTKPKTPKTSSRPAEGAVDSPAIEAEIPAVGAMASVGDTDAVKAAESEYSVSSDLTVTRGDGTGRPGDALDQFFVSENERRLVGDAFVDAAGETRTALGRDIAELLAFGVGDEEYAIDIVEIQEIIKVPPITEVPRTMSSVLGVISLRGTIVPVLDLRPVLRLERTSVVRASRILVIRAEGEPVGLLVDRVTSVVRIEREAIESMPRTMKHGASEYVRGVGRVGDRLLIVLDLAAVMGVLEVAA